MATKALVRRTATTGDRTTVDATTLVTEVA
jgi:hypothetical protein